MINGGACYPATMRKSRLPDRPLTHQHEQSSQYASTENLNAPRPAHIPVLYKRELPDSQESLVSAVSSTSSAPQLPSSSSNLSTSTAGDTELTSPASSNVPSIPHKPSERAIPPSPSRVRGQDAPLRIDAACVPQVGDTAASPMSVDSPIAHGFKRTADGSVKVLGLKVDSSVGPTMGHKRNKSMESNSNTRIGEVRPTMERLDKDSLWLTRSTAFRTAKDSPFVRNGQGSEWVGAAVARRT